MADDLLTAIVADGAAALGSTVPEDLDLRAAASVRDTLAEVVARRASGLSFSDREVLVQRAYDELIGLGETIQPRADDPATNDIVVTGPAEGRVHQGGGRVLSFHPGFPSNRALEEWVRRYAERHGHHVDHASPEVDFAIAHPPGRFHAVIPPAAGQCAQVSIRLFRLVADELSDLVKLRTLSEEPAAFLRAAVRAKCNIIVSGGGGSGKTTITNALGREIPEIERLVTIEDVAELRLATHRTGCSRLYTRRPNIEGKGGLAIEQLIPMALRMCADRIIVGEIRGREAGHVIDVMNTGHEGSITSIHANSATDALDRLVTLVGNTGWNYEFAVRRVAQTIAFVVHMRKLWDGRRVVETVAEVDGAERSGVIRVNDIFAWDGTELRYKSRPRQDHYLRLVEAGWEAQTPAEAAQWR
jgi:pilus assembly protein CpaF